LAMEEEVCHQGVTLGCLQLTGTGKVASATLVATELGEVHRGSEDCAEQETDGGDATGRRGTVIERSPFIHDHWNDDENAFRLMVRSNIVSAVTFPQPDEKLVLVPGPEVQPTWTDTRLGVV